MNSWLKEFILTAAIIALMAAALLLLGRTPWGPDGRPSLWSGAVESPYNSQRFADPYTFTHIAHGIGFYLIIWLFFKRRLSPGTMLVLAILLEAGWEVLENTNFIIERYRAIAIARGYYGDSVFNSVGDVLVAVIGALLAQKFPKGAVVAAFIVLEIFLALAIRDNLTLNIIQLIRPIPAIQEWQLGE